MPSAGRERWLRPIFASELGWAVREAAEGRVRVYTTRKRWPRTAEGCACGSRDRCPAPGLLSRSLISRRCVEARAAFPGCRGGSSCCFCLFVKASTLAHLIEPLDGLAKRVMISMSLERKQNATTSGQASYEACNAEGLQRETEPHAHTKTRTMQGNCSSTAETHLKDGRTPD